jgi:hypothetical protein
MAEKGFRVLTVKEKYYKKVREYYRSILEVEVSPSEFINEARTFQTEIKKNKITNLNPLEVKKIWKDIKVP